MAVPRHFIGFLIALIVTVALLSSIYRHYKELENSNLGEEFLNKSWKNKTSQHAETWQKDNTTAVAKTQRETDGRATKPISKTIETKTQKVQNANETNSFNTSETKFANAKIRNHSESPSLKDNNDTAVLKNETSLNNIKFNQHIKPVAHNISLLSRHHVKARIHYKMRQMHLQKASINSSIHEDDKADEYKHDRLAEHRSSHEHHESHGINHHLHNQFHSKYSRHYFFLNEFIYPLKEVRSCVFQYVKEKSSLHVLYQSMNFEPVTIFIADSHNNVVHENRLRRSGSYENIAETSGSFKICMENYSWGPKKIFLSIRVENQRNTRIMNATHYRGYTTMGRLKNVELEIRTMATQLSRERAAIATDLILTEDRIEFIIWMTWVVLVVSLMTYVLEVMEIHRIFRLAEAKRTFSMESFGRKR